MTFHHFNGKSQSQIDYIMVSKGLHHSCHGYRVRQREPTNVSAHDPVHVTISLNTQIKPNVQKKIPSTKPRPRWESTDLEIYHDLSHSRLQNLISSSDEMSLEQFIEDLSKTLTETAEEAAPSRRKTNKRRKKPWTPKMTAILRELKHFFWRWKSEGRPKDDNPTFRKLQALKKQLQQEQRQEAARQRLQEQDNIMRAHRNDHTVFNKLISKHRGSGDDLPDEMQIDGQLVNGEDLLPALCGYFETLATPKDLPQ